MVKEKFKISAMYIEKDLGEMRKDADTRRQEKDTYFFFFAAFLFFFM